MELMDGPFANPSSTHQFGRKSRIIVEEARKYIASQLNCKAGEIIFTSGGTEADNMALLLPVRDLGIKRIITSPVEHHAVLHSAESIARNYEVQLELVKIDDKGNVDLIHLEELLSNQQPTLVSLMHGNNEIGNLLDLKKAGNLCHQYDALFHSDTVQTIGRYNWNLAELPVDFITASAHKFYGPKGVGFLYMNSSVKVSSMIVGGAQERGMRGGTENIIGIGGLHAAFQTCFDNLDKEREHITGLKNYFVSEVSKKITDIQFNGESEGVDKCLYNIVSVSFPDLKDGSMLLFQLDLKGVAVSGGSACSSGSLKGSHVMEAIAAGTEHPVLRFSFGKDNTIEDLDYAITALEEVLKS